ncbi:hypothetical protein [Mycobacterium sp. 1245852.3]|uniref:hypothetical protein n=1 Tax=Mycobacterium sp. 1245852.3 TaxID=1856860 RepID=UPI0007FDC936|nr:hypothetical protein [Mycobacterium sp. 1245852.3]OBJ93005.1 hypothetical protein A9W96_21300 [Mycobacterium sp. 1245852.3]
MDAAAGPSSKVATFSTEADRRRKRQGSENRQMNGRLQVRFDPDKLKALEAMAGGRLPCLIRECGELLTQLLPLADERGIDPVELIRETADCLQGRRCGTRAD